MRRGEDGKMRRGGEVSGDAREDKRLGRTWVRKGEIRKAPARP